MDDIRIRLLLAVGLALLQTAALSDSKEKSPPPPDQARAFEFLGRLREKGTTNMFGAGPFIMEEFNVSRRATNHLLITWMKTFEPD